LKKPHVRVPPPGEGSGKLKALAGSVSDDFNNIVVNQALGKRRRKIRAGVLGLG
jgi:hypothetical protein